MAKENFTQGYALLIAVNDNLMPNYALPTVAKDTAGLRDVLVHPERCAYPKENVRVLSGRDASREGIYGGLSWLKERVAADKSGNATAVLYYSGHGAVDKDDNSYYFLPYDLRSPLVDSLLRANDVAAEIEQVKPRRLLVILDCSTRAAWASRAKTCLPKRGWSNRLRRPQPAASWRSCRGRGGPCSVRQRPPKAPTCAPTGK